MDSIFTSLNSSWRLIEKFLLGILRKVQFFTILLGYEDELPKDTMNTVQWSRLHEYQFLVLEDKQIIAKILIIVVNVVNQANYFYFNSNIIFAILLLFSVYRCRQFLARNMGNIVQSAREIKLMQNHINPDLWFTYFSPMSVIATIPCLLPPRPNIFAYLLLCFSHLLFSQILNNLIQEKEKQTVGFLTEAIRKRAL